MTNSIVLSAAMRTNLLTLQKTQGDIDVVQNRLATGLKVNSALDNPQNFFTAKSLNNRASDLTRLLDGIGQSIRTIEEADKGVSALTDLVEQADSIVQSARDGLAATEGEARITGNVDLRQTNDLTSLANIADLSQFDIKTVGDDGLEKTVSITIDGGDTADALAAKINNAFVDDGNEGEITAKVNDQGFFEISSKDGRSFRIEESVAAFVGAGTSGLGLAGFQDLGLSAFFAAEDAGDGATTLAAATVISGDKLTSRSIYESAGDLIEAGDQLINDLGVAQTYQDVDGNTVVSGFAAGDTLDFVVNGSATTTVSYALQDGDTFQDVIDSINSNTTVNKLITADFDTQTGQISIQSISGETESLEIVSTTAAASTFAIGLGDPSGQLDPFAANTGNAQDRTYSFSTGSVDLESLANDYNEVRNQIDRIVVDSNYRGINLLQGDNLTTSFNEDRTSSLTTDGVNFSANGLGITEATFASADAIDANAVQTRDALEKVRAFGSTLANDLSIIQTRKTFTSETVNTLKAGADDLTVADLNEEGANLLALQTRQQLGTTSLSLASQSQQAVLRLF